MKIGILDLLAYPARHTLDYLEYPFANKQYAALMPQAISVWCRQMGHQTYYATYYGLGDPLDKLPSNLELVFISCTTYLAPLAYAVSRAYQKRGAHTVIGGPHARSFPLDCQRYFNTVVFDCNRTIIADIIQDYRDLHKVISSEQPLDDIPTVEERLPEIRRSVFWKGRRGPDTHIPILASIGCPYTCDFCCDWNSRYRHLPMERLAADLQFVSENLGGARVVFHDPNFGVIFDETMALLEDISQKRWSGYGIQSTLSNLSKGRLQRLRDTDCHFILASIESWSNTYSAKLGEDKISFQEKLVKAVEHFSTLIDYVPYLNTNIIFGLDEDAGNEPFEISTEFVRRVPFVWPSLHIPIPFGNTPLQKGLLNQGRILRSLPFTFYRQPFLAFILKNYNVITFYEQMVDIFAYVSSPSILRKRIAGAGLPIYLVHLYRTMVVRRRYDQFLRILQYLKNDPQFLMFNEGKMVELPHYYGKIYERLMGKYAELLSLNESCWPELEGL